ncbi:Unknown protein [Striga hermonthica]|uniref:Autophagy-related protein 27 n=1 Tax=Striga hermonthica TaxID=68872 RepID=A0A9N7NM61_STRHE|nr:Unknown protein [Striga hermonthica]
MKTGRSLYLSPRILFPVLILTILRRVSPDSVSPLCELSFKDRNKVYHYSLASPVRTYPHGILSEDGFYKVAINGTLLWFQLCSSMIFNHDIPLCVDCKDCGGQSRCGTGCSALVSNKYGGYPVCTTLGQPSSTLIDIRDKKSPHAGITVKVTNSGPKHNCSLSVSVICNSNGVQGPRTLEKVGFCDYNTELKHPLGCAEVISSKGSGFGFGTFMILILCLFGGYILAGAIYRYFFLHVRGIDVIPNLEFWASLPHRAQSLYHSLIRRVRGPSYNHRSSYSPVNF